MSIGSELKSYLGGQTTKPRTLASASTLSIPDTQSVFYVTGTTTVASLSTVQAREGRLIQLIGASGANFALTHTAIASATSGQVSLAGSNITITRGANVVLRQLSGGNWILVSSAAVA